MRGAPPPARRCPPGCPDACRRPACRLAGSAGLPPRTPSHRPPAHLPGCRRPQAAHRLLAAAAGPAAAPASAAAAHVPPANPPLLLYSSSISAAPNPLQVAGRGALHPAVRHAALLGGRVSEASVHCVHVAPGFLPLITLKSRCCLPPLTCRQPQPIGSQPSACSSPAPRLCSHPHPLCSEKAIFTSILRGNLDFATPPWPSISQPAKGESGTAAAVLPSRPAPALCLAAR